MTLTTFQHKNSFEQVILFIQPYKSWQYFDSWESGFPDSPLALT